MRAWKPFPPQSQSLDVSILTPQECRTSLLSSPAKVQGEVPAQSRTPVSNLSALRMASHNSQERGTHQVASSNSPNPSALGILGWGFSDPLCNASSLSLSLALSFGPQFTSAPHRCPKSPHRAPGAAPPGPTSEHGASGQVKSRTGSAKWNPRGRQSPARPWELCSVNLIPAWEERSLQGPPLGPKSFPGQGAPCLEMRGTQPRSTRRESSPALLQRAGVGSQKAKLQNPRC